MCFFIAFSLSAILIGCEKEKVEEVKLKDEFDVEIATGVVEGYLKSISENNFEESNKYLNEKIKSTNLNEEIANIQLNGYRLEDINESDNKAYFTVKVTQSDKENSRAMLLKYVILVMKENMEYKIDNIDSAVSREIFIDKDSIRMRFDDAIETSLLLNMDGISSYTYPKDNPGKLGMISIPKTQFSMLSLDYEGDMVAFTTMDKNVYIAIAAVDETAKTTADDEKKEDSEEESDKGPKEKPIGKRVITCDLLIDSTVDDICFSMNEKFLAVQYITLDKKRCFRVYQTEGGELIKLKLENEFPLSNVDVVYNNFDKDTLLFSVVPKDESEAATKFKGKYSLDLNTFEIKKAAS